MAKLPSASVSPVARTSVPAETMTGTPSTGAMSGGASWLRAALGMMRSRRKRPVTSATHCPSSQASGASHAPQVPPQLLSPHVTPSHWGTHVMQLPARVQTSSAGQPPQLPVQPSSPQTRPSQSGTQGRHAPSAQPHGQGSSTASSPPQES